MVALPKVMYCFFSSARASSPRPYRRSSFPAFCAPRYSVYAVCFPCVAQWFVLAGLHLLLLHGLQLSMCLNWLVLHKPKLGLQCQCGTSPPAWRTRGTCIVAPCQNGRTSGLWMPHQVCSWECQWIWELWSPWSLLWPILGNEYFVHSIFVQFRWHPCFFASGEGGCSMSKLWRLVNIC